MSTTLLFRNVFDAWSSIRHGRTHFDEEWNRVRETRPATDIQGCWAGTWRSDDHRKQGPIRCVMTRIAPATYVASFCVRGFARFPFTCDVQFRAIEQRNRFDVEGAADLGLLGGGVHHFEGQATLDEFWCSYTARSDRGKLEMKRML